MSETPFQTNKIKLSTNKLVFNVFEKLANKIQEKSLIGNAREESGL